MCADDDKKGGLSPDPRKLTKDPWGDSLNWDAEDDRAALRVWLAAGGTEESFAALPSVDVRREPSAF